MKRALVTLLLISWLLHALALLAVAYFVPGIQVDSFWSALAAAMLLGLLNLLLRPILVLLTLPVTVATLGVFLLIINGLLFWTVGSVISGFQVHDFSAAFFGAVSYSIFAWALTAFLPSLSSFRTSC